LYRQIKSLLMQRLESGEWRPGEAIPSESELAVRFNVSQGTVRKAIDEMAAKTWFCGGRARAPSLLQSRRSARLLSLPSRGAAVRRHRAVPQSVPLECWRAKAGPEVARMLELNIGDSINIVAPPAQFDAKPVVLDEIYLPGDVFQALTLEMLQIFNQDSLYTLFETRFGIRMIRAEERIRAVGGRSGSAELLKVAEGSPLLSVERVSFSYGDKPVEWRRGLYATNEHCYFNQLG
jgi:GntR family transcriptional regulator